MLDAKNFLCPAQPLKHRFVAFLCEHRNSESVSRPHLGLVHQSKADEAAEVIPNCLSSRSCCGNDIFHRDPAVGLSDEFEDFDLVQADFICFHAVPFCTRKPPSNTTFRHVTPVKR
jgi:hypothetical protein